MRKILVVAVAVAICFLVGFLGGNAQELSLATWYPTIVKSPLTPPNIVFPIAWSILYLLMGISIGLVLLNKSKERRLLIGIFCVQLFINWLWSMVFFVHQNPTGAFVVILILDALVIWYIAKSRSNHRASSYLFVPYAVWILFASYLNFYIMVHN